MKRWLLIVGLLLPVVSNAQTCNTAIPASTAHLVGNADGTATDSKTGLMWKRCAEGQAWNGTTNNCDGDPATYGWKAALERTQAYTPT